LADFIKKANYQIRRCQNKGHLPFLVGGTGLYIAAIVNNYNLPKGRIDLGLRKRLSQKNKTELLQYLKELDPATAEVIDQNNPRRLVRALEYVIINQKSFSANQNQTPSPYDILQIGIKTDPEKLNKRITQRTEKMIAAGLIKEVKKITRRYELTLPSLNTIGYQEIGQYLNSEITLDQAITLIKIHTQQYAKRQLTWFKRDPRIKWVKSKTVADKLVNNFLKK
jgi:tRNA dimethylallyltransferase